MLKFNCSRCGQRISAPTCAAGTTGTCPNCAERVDVPTRPRRNLVLTSVIIAVILSARATLLLPSMLRTRSLRTIDGRIAAPQLSESRPIESHPLARQHAQRTDEREQELEKRYRPLLSKYRFHGTDSATLGQMWMFCVQAKVLACTTSDEVACDFVVNFFDGITALSLQDATTLLNELTATKGVTSLSCQQFSEAVQKMYPVFRRDMPLRIAIKQTADTILSADVVTELSRRSQ